MTLSDLIVHTLESLGVEYVFGVPGVHIMGLYEALSRSAARGGPRAILTRHESGAAFMAAGYARESGRLGVCCATAGPGTTNALTGIMSAHSDHLPVLLLTGQGVIPSWGMGYVQESSPYEASYPDIIDTTGMLAHCTRYNSVVTHRLQLESKLGAAIAAALNPSLRGVAHLSIPPDLLNAPWHGRATPTPALQQCLSEPPAWVDQTALERLWHLLSSTMTAGGRIVMHVGHECRDAGPVLEALAERLSCELITTVQGRRWIGSSHPLNKGIFGPLWGHASAHHAIQRAPIALTLSFGTSLTAADTGAWNDALLQNLVHIHPADVYFQRSPQALLHVRGTVQAVAAALLSRLEGAPALTGLELSPALRTGTEYALESRLISRDVPLKPQRIIQVLAERLPESARVVTDIGNALIWTAHYLREPFNRHYHCMFGQVSMGSGTGVAVGVAMAARGTPVVCVLGDGAMLMSGMDFTVAVEEKLPMLFVILNDGVLGMVRSRHRQAGSIPVDLHVPAVDFEALARALGANAVTVTRSEELESMDFDALFRSGGPTLLNVVIDPDEVLRDGM